MLLARILPILDNSIRAQVQTLYDSEPNLALDIFLARVDGFRSYLSAPQALHSNHPRNNQCQAFSKWCANHPLSTSHSTHDCLLNQTAPPSGAQSALSSHRCPNLRFQPKEGQPGTRVCAAVTEDKSENSENSD